MTNTITIPTGTGDLIEKEAAAQIAELDCDWSAFGKSSLPEWDGGPDGVRDYRIGIATGRAIAAAIRAIPSVAQNGEAETDDILVGLGRVADAMGVDDLRLLAQSAMWRIHGLSAERDSLRADKAKLEGLVETLLGVLKRISAPQYGLQGLMEDNAKEEDFTKYWCNMASGFASMARSAIAEYQKWKEWK